MSAREAARPPAVLVVEDEAKTLREIRRAFEQHGFEVKVAREGEAALRIAKDQALDLVITDVSLPAVGGFTLLEAVRQLDPEVPVILTTARPDLDEAVRAIRGGASDYVQKPFAAEDLVERGRRVLEVRQLDSGFRAVRERPAGEAPPERPPDSLRPERAALERAAFRRVSSLVSAAIARASTRTLEQALGEPASSMVLTDVLEEALVEDAPPAGEWAAALMRGAQVKRELLQEAGGALSVNQVAEFLGVTRAAIDKRRRQGTLLGLKLPSGDVAYPAAQFGQSDVLPGLPAVLAAFRIEDPWMRLDTLLARSDVFEGRNAFEALAAGEVEPVRSFVASFGDQGL